MGQVFELVLSRTERDVLLALCDHARDDGTGARPGVHLLAHKTDLSTRQVERYLKTFRQRGIIKPVGGGGHGKAVEYFIDLSKAERKLPFKRMDSRDTKMSSEPKRSDDISRPIRRHTEPNQTTFPAHSDDTKMSCSTSLEPIKPPHTQGRVCSCFSFEQCLAYVNHLYKTNQGVHKPAAFAKAIYRSGSDDAAIATFLRNGAGKPPMSIQERTKRLYAVAREMNKQGVNDEDFVAALRAENDGFPNPFSDDSFAQSARSLLKQRQIKRVESS
jgi:hypothetical protein